MAIDQNKNAVVTLSIGDFYRKISKLTHPLIKAYASKIKADFIVIDQPRINLGGCHHFEKFQLYDLLNRYSRIFFVDTDLIITPVCPDVFSVVPPDHLGAFVVSNYTDYHDDEVRIVQKQLGDLNWERELFNSGVMVISSAHREVFNPKNDLVKKWANYFLTAKHRVHRDQTVINYLVKKFKIPFFDLGYKFNHTTAPKNSRERFSSYVIHYPGSGHRRGSKVAQIQKDLFTINHPILWKISAHFPRITQVLDRLF